MATARVRRSDVWLILAFALYAATFQLGRWRAVHPFVFLGGDAGNIASWAAALDHPERFSGDDSVADPGNFRFYMTLHIPLIRLLARFTGDYGTAFISLLGAHVFLQALGFYVLGRTAFASRFWAALLAAVTLVPVDVPLDNWRTFDDPIPRFTFQALLPFLLASALAARSRPGRQLWILAVAGASMVVHPVSALPWGLALWLGFAVPKPSETSWRRQIRHLVMLAGVFLAASAPFAGNYLAHHAHGVPSDAPALQIQTIMKLLIPRGQLDAGFALRAFLARWLGPEGLIWPAAAAGGLALAAVSGEQRGRVAMVGLWCAGLLCACVLIPQVEQVLATRRGAIPIQIDLVRGLRYLVPIALLLCLWPLAVLERRLERSPGSRVAPRSIPLLGLALAALWIGAHPVEPVRTALSCWSLGRFACAPPGWAVEAEAVEAVGRETPPGARILPSYLAPSLALRYRAQRPVVHCYKDLGVFLYANHARLVAWFQTYKKMMAALARETPSQRFRAHAYLARELGADYALVDSAYLPENWELRPGDSYQEQQLVWRNFRFALFRTARETGGARRGQAGR